MKISKQFLLIAAILGMFFSAACSKSLLRFDEVQSTAQGSQEVTAEARGFPYDPTKKHVFESGIDTAKQKTPDTGATDSLRADSTRKATTPEIKPEVLTEARAAEGDISARGYEKPDSRDFGSTGQGMPGDGASGAFNAGPSSDVAPAEPKSEFFSEESAGETGTPYAGYEKPEPRVFGSAKQGMPGDGASGAFNAGPSSADAPPEPASEFFKEESVGETGTPYTGYEKPEPRVFGSAKQGMPGDGATGSFSAKPFSGDSTDHKIPDDFEPFPVPAEEPEVAVLPPEEEIRRKLPYDPSDMLEDIHFAFDKYDLDDKSRAILKRNADYLSSHANSNIEIQGHCDERGSNNYNITLGERRAQATKTFLVSLGVDENRIHTISYGEERPFCFESNEKCWSQNRRGHFLIAK